MARLVLWAVCKLFGPLPTDDELDSLDATLVEEIAEEQRRSVRP